MDNQEDKIPECFGDLDKVFPMTDTGLRQTPDDCYYHCPVKTKCLKEALGKPDGEKVEEELIERGTKAGVINFFERWSRKKQIHRKKQKD